MKTKGVSLHRFIQIYCFLKHYSCVTILKILLVDICKKILRASISALQSYIPNFNQPNVALSFSLSLALMRTSIPARACSTRTQHPHSSPYPTRFCFLFLPFLNHKRRPSSGVHIIFSKSRKWFYRPLSSIQFR